MTSAEKSSQRGVRLILSHAMQIDAGFDLGASAADFADAFAIERREFGRRTRGGFWARCGANCGEPGCPPVTPLKPSAFLTYRATLVPGPSFPALRPRRLMNSGLAAFQWLDRRRGLPPNLIILVCRLFTAAFP